MKVESRAQVASTIALYGFLILMRSTMEKGKLSGNWSSVAVTVYKTVETILTIHIRRKF